VVVYKSRNIGRINKEAANRDLHLVQQESKNRVEKYMREDILLEYIRYLVGSNEITRTLSEMDYLYLQHILHISRCSNESFKVAEVLYIWYRFDEILISNQHIRNYDPHFSHAW
jgi:hypothetical protein